MLRDYPVVVDIVVRWGDMDALGHVNNIVYLQYFETARVEYLMRLGLGAPGPTWQRSGLIMGSNSCRYRAPVTYPDTLSVGARTSAIGEDRVKMHHTAVSQKLGRVVAEGEAVIVSYDYAAGQRAMLPADIRDAIIALEGREIPRLPDRGKVAGESQ
jgi:acyl-CoA thioester hydrolase